MAAESDYSLSGCDLLGCMGGTIRISEWENVCARADGIYGADRESDYLV